MVLGSPQIAGVISPSSGLAQSTKSFQHPYQNPSRSRRRYSIQADDEPNTEADAQSAAGGTVPCVHACAQLMQIRIEDDQPRHKLQQTTYHQVPRAHPERVLLSTTSRTKLRENAASTPNTPDTSDKSHPVFTPTVTTGPAPDYHTDLTGLHKLVHIREEVSTMPTRELTGPPSPPGTTSRLRSPVTTTKQEPQVPDKTLPSTRQEPLASVLTAATTLPADPRQDR
jgi:hypothetical protein